MQAAFVRIADMLIEKGPHGVGMPYVRSLGGKLWEVRVSGLDGIGRIIYIATSGPRLVLLHAFVKKTQGTPHRALAIARKRMREVFP